MMIFLTLLIIEMNSVLGDLQLRQLYVHTRHGARAPMYNVTSSYDSYWKERYFTEELTTVGQRQHYLLGHYLKSKYFDFLGNYGESFVSAQATSSNRAIRSGLSLLKGLFPEAPRAYENELEKLQYHIPPGIQSDDFDLILNHLGDQRLPSGHQTIALQTDFLPSPVCQKIIELKQKAFQSDTYKSFEKQLKDSGFYDRFSQAFDSDMKRNGFTKEQLNITVVGWFYDSLICDEYENIPLPESLSTQLYKEIKYAYDFQNLWLVYPEREVIKIMASFQTSRINEMMKNPEQKRFHLISGHDGDVNNMLQFFGLQTAAFNFQEHENSNSHQNAPFASSLIYEVWQDDQSNYFVKLIYNGKEQNLSFCQNQSLCTLNEFTNFVSTNTYDEQSVWQACTSCEITK